VALIDVAMADRMVEDVRTLAKIDEAELHSERTGGAGRRLIPYLFFGPEHRGSLGELAAHTRDTRPKTFDRLWRDVRRPDLSVFGWLAGGDGVRRGDLLSYLSFEPRFIENAITLGQHDARRLLGSSGAIPWLPPRSVATPAREGRAT
jgi:NTE family protein